MKANELRIGNNVLFKDKIVEVAVISGIVYSFGAIDITILIDKKLEMHPLKSMKPIPLTEDVLLKCGFAVVYDSDYTKRLALIEDTRFDFLINKLDFESSGIRYKGDTHYHNARYLHELQNLYFAITKQELEVKL